MNYQRIYNHLMTRAKYRIFNGYGEWHHIKPRCMGGTDSKRNMTFLTAREHFVAHQLLVKMYPDEPKLVYAAHMMTVSKNGERIHNRLYEWLKIRLSIEVSKLHSGKIVSEETKERMRGLRPHVNQTGKHNNNAHPIKTPYGKFSTIQECAMFMANKLNLDVKRARKYVQDKLKNLNEPTWIRLTPKSKRQYTVPVEYKPRIPKGVCRINNGVINTYLKPNEPMLDGYTYGWFMVNNNG